MAARGPEYALRMDYLLFTMTSEKMAAEVDRTVNYTCLLESGRLIYAQHSDFFFFSRIVHRYLEQRNTEKRKGKLQYMLPYTTVYIVI